MQKVSVILPTYNERDNIQHLVTEIFRCLRGDVEVIVVDDASYDGTWEKVEDIAKRNKNVRLLKRKKRFGIASAISEGISVSSGDIIAWMDADFSMPPELLPMMISALKESHIAVGSRYATGGSDKRMLPVRKFTSKTINVFARFLLNGKVISNPEILDYTSGFIATWRNVVDNVPIRGVSGEYCIDFLYNSQLKGFKITEIPYTCLPRRSGESKISPDLFSLLKQGFRYCIAIFRLKFKR